MPLTDFLKRTYIWYFDRERVNVSLKQRMGSCKQCGLCCTIFNVRCIFLDRDNKCSIHSMKPNLLCKIPPLNLTEGEILKHKKLGCGYFFEEPPEDKSSR